MARKKFLPGRIILYIGKAQGDGGHTTLARLRIRGRYLRLCERLRLMELRFAPDMARTVGCEQYL
ncbi:hypothetical protein CF119_01020 [Aeromonas sobria]|nr:hypothetical protein CF119_01020 [Aeromonas sobria]